MYRLGYLADNTGKADSSAPVFTTGDCIVGGILGGGKEVLARGAPFFSRLHDC
jgi:hypothetical protein